MHSFTHPSKFTKQTENHGLHELKLNVYKNKLDLFCIRAGRESFDPAKWKLNI